MDTPPIWNKNEILQQLSGDETFLRELLGDLKTLVDETMPALRSALTQGDLAKAGSLSHTLKGSSGNLAAMEVYHLSRELEMDCKSGGASAEEKYLALEAGCRRLLEELKNQGQLD